MEKARKFVYGSALFALLSMFCCLLTYDGSSIVAGGFALITFIVGFISYKVDRKFELYIWE